MESKTCVSVVTVTYGDRWTILEEVLENVIHNPSVTKVIIVDNMSKHDLKSKAKQLSEKIEVIKMDSNTGSAHGFKTGITHALKDKNCQYIWLLDDDNRPEKDALDELFIHFNMFLKETTRDLLALLSLRNDRNEFILSSKYQQSERFFPLRNSFLGIHYKDLAKKVIKKFSKNNIDISDGELHIVKVPLAPYGGLFFDRRLIERIGLPNEQFYLYSDDYEFSHRITKVGGDIILIPSSKITDIDKSWFIKENNGFFLSLFKSDSELRIYYSVRNRIYFEKKELVDNKFIYTFNKTLFLVLANIISILFRKKSRKDLIKKAILDGTHEKLGRVKNII